MDERERLIKAIEREKKIKSDHYEGVAIQERRIAELEAELAALPPAPVRLIIQYDVEDYIDIGVANEPWVATVCKSRCGQHKIDPQALAAHIRAFSQPDPNAEAIAAADALAEAVRNFMTGPGHSGLVNNCIHAYRKAREGRAYKEATQ